MVIFPGHKHQCLYGFDKSMTLAHVLLIILVFIGITMIVMIIIHEPKSPAIDLCMTNHNR